MARRSTNSHNTMLKALPFFARLRREEPFRSADDREWNEAAERIAGPTGWYSSAGWREHAGCKLIHFATPAEADAMQSWIAESGIEARPPPEKPSKAVGEAADRALIEWAISSGAGRAIVQAYRRAIYAGGGSISGLCAAYKVAEEVGCPKDGLNPKVERIIDWANTTYPEWFARCRPPEEPKPTARSTAAVVSPQRSAPEDPQPPRWRPTF